jgi:hypothetical protein
MKRMGGPEVKLHAFLTSAKSGGDCCDLNMFGKSSFKIHSRPQSKGHGTHKLILLHINGSTGNVRVRERQTELVIRGPTGGVDGIQMGRISAAGTDRIHFKYI